jgi:hypothetical protein
MHQNSGTISELLERRRGKRNETSVRKVGVWTRDLNTEPNRYKGPGLQDRTPRYQERLGVAIGVLTNGKKGYFADYKVAAT